MINGWKERVIFLVNPVHTFFIRNILDLDRAPCFLKYFGDLLSKKFLKCFLIGRKNMKRMFFSCVFSKFVLKMFLIFQRIALDISQGLGQCSPMFLILFLIKWIIEYGMWIMGYGYVVRKNEYKVSLPSYMNCCYSIMAHESYHDSHGSKKQIKRQIAPKSSI